MTIDIVISSISRASWLDSLQWFLLFWWWRCCKDFINSLQWCSVYLQWWSLCWYQWQVCWILWHFWFILMSLLFRCNSDPDCFDLSDEFDCRIISPGKSYQSFIAPPPLSYIDLNKVQIDVSADLVSILDIDEISSIFQVQFFLYFSWHDPRFNYQHFKTC